MSQGVYKKELSVFGDYFQLACSLAGMNWSDVAERSGVERSTITKALRSTSQPRTSRPSRELVLKWCDILQPPEELMRLMFHSLGYATPKDEEEAIQALEAAKVKFRPQ